MPFENQITLAFTVASVRKNAPAQSGVYGLASASEWIFVGQSDDIQTNLLQHLRESGTFLNGRKPTGFTFELCAPAGRIARQDRLVRELEPVCNRGSRGAYDSGGRTHSAHGSG
jgi:hypothetical protein